MSESISQRINAVTDAQSAIQLRALLEATRTDIVALATALDTLATKLNADAGVTDTNYATTNAASVTLTA